MAWDPIWEQIFRQRAWGEYPGEELIRFVARNFYSAPDRKNVKLLEVGCGTGANLWYMAREGFTVHGIDGSAEAVRLAADRLNRECPGWSGQLIRGDIGRLPFQDDLFDGVIDNEAVCCNPFDSSREIYAELSRVTKPGGKLFSRTFALGCWGDGTGEPAGHHAWIVAEGPMKGLGFTRFTAEDEIPLLIQGFEVTEKELLTRTCNGGRNRIAEWIVHGVKP